MCFSVNRVFFSSLPLRPFSFPYPERRLAFLTTPMTAGPGPAGPPPPPKLPSGGARPSWRCPWAARFFTALFKHKSTNDRDPLQFFAFLPPTAYPGDRPDYGLNKAL